ncbi:SMP-30/gluconolactonase/LRE family protein [Enterovibrio sp. ZSDZ42]|uniref:SMP-30/gluconolactonase/LRE family protein n=1 Tax=Enterovibrio gelatinilyticus TaxID=2899819 RepID=A0ABT5R2H1_9GAMM|nr:SMP-30/gluconolactonase/LRE family protein [Enterovibrio sp. ZSDZ42]MDD1794463.1 SMP-30/gluconolactonase/LRE family protein [Enterovibrio sp. ZSDZ42]
MKVAELLLDCNNDHGEGVFWDHRDGKVRWTDMFASKIWSYDPKTQLHQVQDMPSPVCCFAPRAQGGFVVAFNDRISLFDLQHGELECLHWFEPSNPHSRLNDGKVDREGNFVVGGMNEGTFEADSSVIHLSKNHKVTTLIENVACANGICFHPDDNRMYFADTPNGEIIEYQYDAKKAIATTTRTLMRFDAEPGLPDGSCVDSDGGVWNAEWDGGRVVRISPEGVIDRVIEIPVDKPTCCAFGGEHLDTLYITTSKGGAPQDAVASEHGIGGLFSVKPGFQGVIDQLYGG